MHKFVPLTVGDDHGRVLDLCGRAADYIQLETGKYPDASYVSEVLTEAPPNLTTLDVFAIGIEREDGDLAGFATYLRHFYKRDEWYMGLLLLDPNERGNGLGRHAAEYVCGHAKSDGGVLIRIAVLDINPRGRKFWEGLGFAHDRTVPAAQNEDGQARHVLRKAL